MVDYRLLLLLTNPTGKIVLESENTVCVAHDVTRHAELNLVSAASQKFGLFFFFFFFSFFPFPIFLFSPLPLFLFSEPSYLEKCVLYTSTEPCAMCSGAIYWSGIRHIVFACNEGLLGEIVGRKQKESGQVKELGDKDGGLGVECKDIFRGRAKIEGLKKGGGIKDG